MTQSVAAAEQQIKDHCKEVAKTLWQWKGEIDVTLKPLGAGKNFLSDAYFATMKNHDNSGKDTSRKIFIKVPPTADPTRKYIYDSMATSLKPFEREYVMYALLTSEYKEMCEANNENGKELTNYFSDAFFLQGELSLEKALNTPILLEDLGASGFKMWENEFDGLDIQHAIKVIEALGRHHGLGMVYVDKKKTFDKEIYAELLRPDFSAIFNDDMMDMMKSGLQLVVDWMEKVKYNSAELARIKSLKTGIKQFFESIYQSMQTMEPLSFTHGDCRLNNFMFKYASDGITPIEVKIVDFQSWSLCPPTLELGYFLFSSLSKDLLLPNFDIIFQAYYTSMAGVLARLNYSKQRPSMEALKKVFLGSIKYAFIMTAGMLHIVFTGNPDLEQTVKDKRIGDLLETAKYFYAL